MKTKEEIIEIITGQLRVAEGSKAKLLLSNIATMIYVELDLKNALASQGKWVSMDMPKDGTKIIRNHVLYGAMVVYYKKGVSAHKDCVWITTDASNSYPEHAFTKSIWQYPPTKP